MTHLLEDSRMADVRSTFDVVAEKKSDFRW